ncbi:MAG: hypothetical protein CMN75_05610 [Spirochaeta sp.]|nr:hypothetical protein [Spirochaeta sp.]RPG10907.1 MAG: SOS response-associated peptidase [Proteobacteria bacterium TMED72]
MASTSKRMNEPMVAAGWMMCGRMVLTRSANEVAEYFGAEPLDGESAFGPRFNVAPSQPILAVRQEEGDARRVVALHWGLIPFWVKDRSDFSLMINARSETAATKPSFRAALRKRRCLVPADGFYEWAKKAKGTPSQGPYYFHAPESSLLAIAGIWESWVDQGSGEVIESCALLTVGANALMSRVHHRMPVLVEKPDWGDWLDGGQEDPDRLGSILAPAAEDRLEAFQVGRYVNQARNEGARCVEPLD